MRPKFNITKEIVVNNDNWIPLSVRRNQRQPFTPFDGVPDFLWQYAMRWIENAVDDDASIVCGLSIDLRLERAGSYLDYQGAKYAIRHAWKKLDTIKLQLSTSWIGSLVTAAVKPTHSSIS